MKPNMKKKFDFSAEMSEAEAIKATPKNEYLEEEKQLLDINAKELVSLNDNVYKLRTEVENLSVQAERILAIHYSLSFCRHLFFQIRQNCKSLIDRLIEFVFFLCQDI